MLDFEINNTNEKRKILWVSCSNEYVKEIAKDENIIGYFHKNTNKILTKRQYNEILEQEIGERWWNTNLNEITDFENFDDFIKDTLKDIENEYEALVEIVIDENDDIERYNPYIKMHWLEILALENEVSIYQIAKKGGLSTSTLYSMIDRDTQIYDISDETLNKILKGLNMNIFEFIYKYDGRLI